MRGRTVPEPAFPDALSTYMRDVGIFSTGCRVPEILPILALALPMRCKLRPIGSND